MITRSRNLVGVAVMATGGEEVLGSNMSSEAFRKHYEELLTAIQEPEVLAAGLYTRGVVTKNLMEEVSVVGLSPMQKKMRLLLFVTDQIAVDPTNLEKFLEALKNQPSAVRVAERLERTYCTLTGQPSTQPISQGRLHPIAQQPAALNPVLSLHPYIAPVTQQLQVQPAPFPPALSHQQPPSLSAIETYAYYLKFDVYLRQKFPTYGKWPPNTAKKYINLALIKKQKMSKEQMDYFTKQTIRGNIDDIVHEKVSISMETIGQPKGNILPKCILVEGAPGVGKSTFAWKLCRKWSKGKLLQQYRLVILLRLRDKRVREAKSVSDLFYYYNRHVQQTVVEEIHATGGRGVLLLFEGYDELPAKLRSKGSIFLDVIKAQVLPTATVLITSRPSASGPLYEECRDFIAQHVEILGFTHENIQLYLHGTTSHDPSLLQGLQQYLTYYPHIRSMLYIPLNCAIVVEVYRVYKSSKSLIPKTWTDLYSSLLRSLLLRYLDDHPVHQRRSWTSNSFRDLPADVYQQLCEVGRIAYEGILQDQQVIFSDLPSDFNSLGLMQCVPELYVDEVAAESFNFLHLTLQEYMAALHLSEQPVEKQIELFQKYCQQRSTQHGIYQYSNDQPYTHFRTVLWFLAGLGKFADYPASSIRSLLHTDSDDSSSSQLWISLDGLHWMFEAACRNVGEAIGMTVVGVELLGTVTSFDCFVLGYCVSHSNCPWEAYLDHCGVGDDGVMMLVRGAMEGESKHSGYISVMNMIGNKITSTGLEQLLKIPQLLKLRELHLSSNPLGRGGAVSLLKSPLVYSLVELRLAETGIGVEDCQAVSELFTVSPTLQRLNISYNALHPESVELIISGLKNHTVLEKLSIAGSQFNLRNCISLASVTQPPRDLNLEDCCIDDKGAIEVARLLKQNAVTSLWLGGNPIIAKGASAIAEVLPQNSSLRKLDLSHESIDLEGTKKLINSLVQNSTLETLCLPEKYESTFKTSEAYKRVKGRIMWKNPILYVHRIEMNSEPLPSTLEEEGHISDSRALEDTTHQPHPHWLRNPSTMLGHLRGTTPLPLLPPSLFQHPTETDIITSEPQPVILEESVDSLDSEQEDWTTPPTSPTHPGSVTSLT